jgi:selenocysteine lyase/cysteine desulfurase
MYGPKGQGALYIRRKPRVKMEAILSGGGQERYGSLFLAFNLSCNPRYAGTRTDFDIALLESVPTADH